jgi:hypothetical protein
VKFTCEFKSPDANPATLYDVQLEVGTLPTTFEYRTYGAELNLCKRFYQILDEVFWQGDATSGENYVASVQLPVEMYVGGVYDVAFTLVVVTGFIDSPNYSATPRMLQLAVQCNSTGAAKQFSYNAHIDAEMR